jgi:transcriptional regulator with XRE-family HTH domain
MKDITPQGTTENHTGPLATTSDETFARRLAELRKDAGLTQKQVADAMTAARIAMHRTAVAKIEAGDRAVSVGEAVQFAAVLGVRLDELVTGPGPDSELERARASAQVKARALELELAGRTRALREDRALLQDTAGRLAAAMSDLAELVPELAGELALQQELLDGQLAENGLPPVSRKED